MIYSATKEIERVFKEKELKYEIAENDAVSALSAKFSAEKAGSFQIYFFSSDEDTDVYVRIPGLVRVPENKRENVLPVVNELNSRVRFFRLFLDKDGDVNLQFDMLQETPMSAVGKAAYELCVRAMQIVDVAYPELMKAIWS